VKTGDLWQCEEHRLICSDCTDPAVVERLMQGKKSRLVFTSPPYNNSTGGFKSPPMHSINMIIPGDCLSVMAEMPDNSIDAIVTDPPYGLKFMNKDWDHGIPGIPYWEEALRVAKPGAHLLCFGGTRTYHRLTCAIEDAGWEIRDCIMWVYGCISEDTEILTTNGWERHHRNIINSHILTYNVDNGTFAFDKPSKVFFYQNKHPAYSIRSDYTDQIVSRNHRCIVERNGREVFRYAETLEREESIPFLENLYDLPETIPDIYEGTSIAKQDLLSRVQQKENLGCKNGETETVRTEKNSKNNLSGVRKADLETGCMGEKDCASHMQQEMQWNTPGGRLESICSHGTGWMVRRCGGKVKDTYDWILKSCMERRSNLLQNARELYRRKICAMSRKIQKYGSEGWVYNGAPVNHGSTSGKMSETNRSNSSQRSRSIEQQDRKPDDIQIKSRAQGVRMERAAVTEIEYNGNVWCISVLSGAFVARRNGKIFITGNSGFPKSMNISKAIDKAAGAEREVVGFDKSKWRNADNYGGGKYNKMRASDYETKATITAPATPEAKQWDGWGTALKPAYEPVIMARKPIEGTVANNVLTYGTGGLNIDECRVSTNGEQIVVTGYLNDIRGGGYGKSSGKRNLDIGVVTKKTPEAGRFPANLIHDGSDEVVGLFPEVKSGGKKTSDKANANGLFRFGGQMDHDVAASSGSASRFFYCAKASPKERGKFNNHPTVKPLSLMEYLCKLITPPGGTILDPFAGSGSTLIAALECGFTPIGIEQNIDYVKIAETRIRAFAEAIT